MASISNIKVKPVSFSALKGWNDDNQADALAAFRLSCDKFRARSPSARIGGLSGKVSDWLPICDKAVSLGENPNHATARDFFQTHFFPVAISAGVGDQGLFTGYFEPEVAGSRHEDEVYNVPLYRQPDDLFRQDRDPKTGKKHVNPVFGAKKRGRLSPFLTREQIEKGALKGRNLEIAYLKDPVDAFFLHIQGSGRIRLSEGGTVRVSYKAKNGHAYTAIGGVLADKGEIDRKELSMQSIRAWLAANPDQANMIMWHNKSFIFFRETGARDDDTGPVAAGGVPLTPGRSLAVDKTFHGLGTPIWLETTMPGKDEQQPIHRLMVAQDTGSAILGAVRGDYFWGTGDAAGALAGEMKSRGRMFALLPLSLKAVVAKKVR